MNSLSKYFLVGMMGILAQFPLFGQTEKLQQFWNEYAFVNDLNQKWAVEADAGLTSSGVPQHNTIFYGFTQFNLRAWVHYYPADRWKLSFFGAYYFNVNVPELNQNEAPEYRFAVQATYNLLKNGRLSVNLRGRIEDRNIENESGIFEAVERFRFQGRAVYFLNEPRMKKNAVYAFLSDELYFKTQSEISGDEFFDRNRVTLGLGCRATKDFQIEISFANEYLPRSAVDKVYNALQVNVTFNNLVSNAIKPFMRKKASVDDGAPSGGGG